jgi:hypothetical protein
VSVPFPGYGSVQCCSRCLVLDPAAVITDGVTKATYTAAADIRALLAWVWPRLTGPPQHRLSVASKKASWQDAFAAVTTYQGDPVCAYHLSVLVSASLCRRRRPASGMSR